MPAAAAARTAARTAAARSRRALAPPRALAVRLRRLRGAALGRALGLSEREIALLLRLDTPAAIQRFLVRLPANHEPDGDTVLSVRRVLRERRAHCIEGAFVAACALWLHGERPLVLHLDCALSDHPHVVALVRRGRCWGAISKANGVRLRYRDPVYRSVRELAMSYLHEYHDRRGVRTLRSVSRPFDLARLDPVHWVTGEAACWAAHDALAALPHVPLLSAAQARSLARLDPFERRVNRLRQYPPPR